MHSSCCPTLKPRTRSLVAVTTLPKRQQRRKKTWSKVGIADWAHPNRRGARSTPVSVRNPCNYEAMEELPPLPDPPTPTGAPCRNSIILVLTGAEVQRGPQDAE